MTRADLALIAALLLAAVLVAVGAGMVYAPAGLITGGLLLAAVATLAHLGRPTGGSG